MGRRVSTGIVGTSGFGNISVSGSTLTTATTNEDLTLDPNGTGRVLIDTDLQLNAQSDLRFADSDSSNWIAFQAPTTVSSNVTWTLPSTDGSANQALVTNGSGTLSWSAAGASISNETSSSSTFYPTLSSVTTGSASTINTSSTKLTFQPSTGTLTCTALSAGTITETSSIALKENLSPINDALGKVMNLQAFTYDRKDGTSYNEAGLIAEEVYAVLPNLVKLDDSGKPHSIMYTKLTAYLIECVKTLKQELDSLKV